MAFTKPNVNDVWAGSGTIVSPGSAKVAQGWVKEIPDFEFENWIQNRQDQFNAHVNQYGIPVWDSVTEYLAGKSYVQGSDGNIYKAITTNTNKDPVSNPTDWERAFNEFGDAYTKAESDGRYLAKTSNLSDLTNTATARNNLSVYSKAETDSKYLVKTNNLSDVSNVTTARNNLSVYSKAETDAAYLAKSSNLSDLSNVATARNNLSVYSKAETDAAYLAKSSNLSDLPNKATARNNLGLGTAALRNIGTGASDVLEVSEADSRYISVATGDDRWLQQDNNFTDVENYRRARENLGFKITWSDFEEKVSGAPSVASGSFLTQFCNLKPNRFAISAPRSGSPSITAFDYDPKNKTISKVGNEFVITEQNFDVFGHKLVTLDQDQVFAFFTDSVDARAAVYSFDGTNWSADTPLFPLWGNSSAFCSFGTRTQKRFCVLYYSGIFGHKLDIMEFNGTNFTQINDQPGANDVPSVLLGGSGDFSRATIAQLSENEVILFTEIGTTGLHVGVLRYDDVANAWVQVGVTTVFPNHSVAHAEAINDSDVLISVYENFSQYTFSLGHFNGTNFSLRQYVELETPNIGLDSFCMINPNHFAISGIGTSVNKNLNVYELKYMPTPMPITLERGY